MTDGPLSSDCSESSSAESPRYSSSPLPPAPVRPPSRIGSGSVIVDYLQLIEIPDRRDGENHTQQVSNISRTLKQLARELGCPVIALLQLSSNVENRNPPIPILSDLRESGLIEQDADSVAMLYREGAYNEDCENPSLTDVYVRKNRNGPTGRIVLQFVKERMMFRPLRRVPASRF